MLQADHEYLAHNGLPKNMEHVEKNKISRLFKVLLDSDIQAYSSENRRRRHVAYKLSASVSVI